MKPRCSEPKCRTSASKKGLCHYHHRRARPARGLPPGADVQKLRDFIEARCVKTSYCWNWTRKLRKGYGHMTFAGIPRGVHVWAHIAFIGEVPAKQSVLHSCDNRACVNPAHLSAGTPQQNSQDMHDRGRHPRTGPYPAPIEWWDAKERAGDYVAD